MAHFGGEHLAHALQLATTGGSAHSSLSPEATLTLLDALGGTSTRSEFLGKCIKPLLLNLHIDWRSFEGPDFGELFSTLLMATKSPASHSEATLSPEEAGSLLNTVVFSDKSYTLRTEDLAVAIQIMWEEGFSWGNTVGKFLSHFLPPGWAVSHASELICCLVQGFLDSDELDLVDYESLDRAESDSHNPAIKLGNLLDALVPREQQTVNLCAEIIRTLHLEFGVASPSSQQQGGDGGRDGGDRDGGGGGKTSEKGPWQRAALFGGRVLQQLKGMQRGNSSSHGNPNTSGGGGSGAGVNERESQDWKVVEAVCLACALCSGPNVGDVDWRSGRSVHAYFVGDVLKQLIKIWKPEYLSALMASLQNSENFPAGSAAAPRRIISEVMEGLGADYSVVIERSHDQESTKRPSTPPPAPDGDDEDESRI